MHSHEFGNVQFSDRSNEKQAEIVKNHLFINEMQRIDDDMHFLASNYDYENIIIGIEKYKNTNIFGVYNNKCRLYR